MSMGGDMAAYGTFNENPHDPKDKVAKLEAEIAEKDIIIDEIADQRDALAAEVARLKEEMRGETIRYETEIIGLEKQLASLRQQQRETSERIAKLAFQSVYLGRMPQSEGK